MRGKQGLKMEKTSTPFDMCAFCPDLCLDQCPVVQATGSSAFSPHAKMLSGWLWKHGVVEGNEGLARLAFQCTGCQACFEVCEHKVDVASNLIKLRAEWFDAGLVPYDTTLIEKESGCPWPLKKLVKEQARAVPRRYFVPEAQAVLFPGCTTLINRPALVRLTFLVLEALGIEFVAASESAAVCCGYPLYALGLRQDFSEHARKISKAFKKYKLVVVLSPCCAHTFRNLYPTESPMPRVTTALELAAPLILRNGRNSLGISAAYHDSCFLSRHLGLTDLPREVLTHVLGMPPVELRRNRKNSACCGHGAAWELVSPAYAAKAAQQVLEMAADAGAQTLISASASCLCHLESSISQIQAQGKNFQLFEIFEVLGKWLGITDQSSKP